MPVSRARLMLPMIVLLTFALAVACRDREPSMSKESNAMLQVDAQASEGRSRNGAVPPAGFAGNTGRTEGVTTTTTAARAPRQRQSASPPVLTVPSTSMVIRNGDVSVQVDSIEASIALIRQLAVTLGGYIGNISMNTGEQQVRSATLELKIPANRFDDAMAGMSPLGKVERSTAMAEDVGEEFVDVSARVANAKRLEARLVTLLATRTGKLEDVLAVERELARVREEIERYEGRIRYLGARVATSTIMVTVHERAPLVAAHPGTNVIAHAVVNMWRNFVRVIAGGIELLGIVIPVAVLAWLFVRGWLWWRQRRPAPLGKAVS